jgi:excisionase family DNA binding protein
MKIYHRSDVDYISIDFKDEVESKSYFENGVVVREDKRGNVIGIDITDSSKFFAKSDLISLQEACTLLGVSESTLRRYIKKGKLKFKKPNGKDYRFKKSDVLKLVS